MTELEKTIGVEFRNADLLKEALTHRSYLNENSSWNLPHNERLEFLGDAVLELAITEELYKRFPDFPEGQLTVLRAALVNYQHLSKVASEFGLEKYIYMSRGERSDASKAREVILANAIEAVIGAIYLDQGFLPVKEFTERFILIHLPEILETKSYKDAKSQLQEVVQERLRLTPTYRVLEESGPAHRRSFKIGVYFGSEIIAEGRGTSKQEAEIEAARAALEKESA
jgi:ribonuclease III